MAPLLPDDPFETGLAGFRFWRKHEFGKKLLRKIAPRYAAKREAKWAARKGRRLPAAEAVNGEYFTDNEGTPMLQGFKSLSGLVTIVVGFALQLLGVGDCDPAVAECVSSEALTTQIVGAADQIVLALGTLVTAWGVIDKARREKKLKRELEAAKAGG